MKYAVYGFTLLIVYMLFQHPHIFFGAIEKIDAKFRQWAEWILK